MLIITYLQIAGSKMGIPVPAQEDTKIADRDDW